MEQSISKLVFDKKSFGLTTGDRDCLKVGDVVMGYKIVKIDSNKVTLVNGEKKIELSVNELFVRSFE